MSKNTQNSILHIHLEEELQKYNLEGRWNDYIAVQKEVLKVLREDNFFVENIVAHKESGMFIKITPRGIRETFGNGKRFNTTSKLTKQRKVATIIHIKELITTSKLTLDNFPNFHPDSNSTFAYFENELLIDDITFSVRITVQKKISTNLFYIHHIDEI